MPTDLATIGAALAIADALDSLWEFQGIHTFRITFRGVSEYKDAKKFELLMPYVYATDEDYDKHISVTGGGKSLFLPATKLYLLFRDLFYRLSPDDQLTVFRSLMYSGKAALAEPGD